MSERLMDILDLEPDSCASVDLSAAECARRAPVELWKRHFGLPPDDDPASGFDELLVRARERFGGVARPHFAAARRSVRTSPDGVHVRDSFWRSPLLARGFDDARVGEVVVIGITAGRELDAEISRLWDEGLPDESLALGALAIAVVEGLRHEANATLRARSSVLPHYSPGYDGWPLTDQKQVRALLPEDLPIAVNEEASLSPVRSTFAVYGLSSRPEEFERGFWDERGEEISSKSFSYRVAEKALAKWGRERLRVRRLPDDVLEVEFLFDGTTCSQLGLPLALEYQLRLEESAGELVLRSAEIAVPERPNNHCSSSCAALAYAETWRETLADEVPRSNLSLEELLSDDRDVEPAGCVCTRASRRHKWRLVLETVHYHWRNHG